VGMNLGLFCFSGVVVVALERIGACRKVWEVQGGRECREVWDL